MRRVPTRNPRTGALDYELVAQDAAEVSACATQLRMAQPGWQARPLAERLELLDAWGRDIAGSRELLEALVDDTGRLPISQAELRVAEVLVPRWRKDAPALLDENGERPSSAEGILVSRQLVPYPLVGFITPWNSPLGLSLIDSIPALVAGCAALVKPSEVTPRFIEPLRSVTARHPEVAGVFALASGDGATGEAVIDAVDAVCFTGSVATGRRVAQRAAGRLIPAFLELGGKDPAIVLVGADLDRAVPGLLWGAVNNTGQLCHSIERIYVHRSLMEPFLGQLVAQAGAVKLARPTLQDGPVGPIIFERQAKIIAAHLQDALAQGARILAGGPPELDGGWWMRPTVVVDVNHRMRLMREETFGPILPVMPFDTPEEAIALANDTNFGLSACVWGPEPEARRIARALNAGGISINDVSLSAVTLEGEKMAFGESGLGGSRMGATSILRFVRRKALLCSRGTGPDPGWFQPQDFAEAG